MLVAENVGPLSRHTIARLTALGIPFDAQQRHPLAVTRDDLHAASHIVAVKKAEHHPLIEAHFPAWLERVEFWDIHDVDCATASEAIPALESQVLALLSRLSRAVVLFLLLAVGLARSAAGAEPPLTISWKDNYLTIRGDRLPGDALVIHYLEAYCRPGSTDRDWSETVIKHRTQLISADDTGRRIELRCRLEDGVQVRHTITAGDDEVDFRLEATNPTKRTSDVHWAQPCIRVDSFTGRGQDDYISKCFVFLDGQLTRLPTQPWATKARYVPGQVYCPKHVDRDDVNPRPLSELVPSSGLCGAFSADDKWIMATAWEPYQELFQGVRVCMHSDLRIGGLKPGETKKIRGKIYVVPADVRALVNRYERDFPEHRKR